MGFGLFWFKQFGQNTKTQKFEHSKTLQSRFGHSVKPTIGQSRLKSWPKSVWPKSAMTHRWWSESEGPDIEEEDVYSLAAAACVGFKLRSARYPDPAPSQLPDPRQLAPSLTNLTALAAALGRRQPRNVPPLHTAQPVHVVVVEEHRILSFW